MKLCYCALENPEDGERQRPGGDRGPSLTPAAGRALDSVLKLESEALDPESMCSGLAFGNVRSPFLAVSSLTFSIHKNRF